MNFQNQKDMMEDVVDTEEIEKENVIMESRAAQTDDVSEKCICVEEVEKNELIMKEDKIICLFKRVKCDQDEWDEIDDAVEDSEIDQEDMLDQWSKVMEGYYRRENKKEQFYGIVEKDIQVNVFKQKDTGGKVL